MLVQKYRHSRNFRGCLFSFLQDEFQKSVVISFVKIHLKVRKGTYIRLYVKNGMTQVYKLRQTNVDNGNIHLYIYECQKYVTEEFTLYLKSKEAEKKRNALENIRTLSYAYINFYIEHPTYYSFMYRNTYIKIEFTMEKKDENYPPYNVFREQ